MLKLKNFQYLSAFVAKVLYCPENSDDWGEFVIDLTTDDLISEKLADGKWSRSYLVKAAAHVARLWDNKDNSIDQMMQGGEVLYCWS